MFTIRQRQKSLIVFVSAMIAFSIVAISGPFASAESAGAPESFATDAYQDPDATPAMTSEEAIAKVTSEDGTLRFDVAEDATRFFFAEQPVHDDGMPAYGNPFVTQGYIYPEGTLDGTNGVLADGSPEFPDQVVGEWTCRGWFIGDGAHTTSGAWVITTQMYDFNGTILITEGSEIADVDVTIDRAITGGTGPFATVTGQGNQTLLGFNATEGVVLRFELGPTES